MTTFARIFVAACVLAAALGAVRADGTAEFVPGRGLHVATADGNYSLDLGFYTQFRYQWLNRNRYKVIDPLNVTRSRPVQDVGGGVSTFGVRRARLLLGGTLGRPWITYGVQLDLAADDEGLRNVFVSYDSFQQNLQLDVRSSQTDRDGRTVKLLDYYIQFAPSPYWGFRLGQFKLPFGRQELVSDDRLAMPSRSIASDYFAPGRDRGVMFTGGTESRRILWRAGAFNGTGIGQAENFDKSLGYAARFAAAIVGASYDESESMLDAAPGIHLQAGFSWYSTKNEIVPRSSLDRFGDIQDDRAALDVQFIAPRVHVSAEYFTRSVKVNLKDYMPTACYAAALLGRLSCDQRGAYAQVGVLVAADHELTARWAQIDNDTELAHDSRTEAALGWTWFFRKHALRWSTSVSRYVIGYNADGSSGMLVQRGIAPWGATSSGYTFEDNPFRYPGLTADRNTMVVTQLQWSL